MRAAITFLSPSLLRRHRPVHVVIRAHDGRESCGGVRVVLALFGSIICAVLALLLVSNYGPAQPLSGALGPLLLKSDGAHALQYVFAELTV